MKKNIFIVVILIVILIGGCSNNDDEKSTSYQMEYDVIETGDGSTLYQIDGKKYENLLEVSGRSNSAECDSYYIVLSNDSNITFEDVDKRFWSSSTTEETDFYIIEYGIYDK